MQALFWSGTLNNISGFRCRHLGCLTGRGGLVQRGCRAGGGAKITPAGKACEIIERPLISSA